MTLNGDSRGLAHQEEFQFLTKNTLLAFLHGLQYSYVETEVSAIFHCNALFVTYMNI